MNRNLRKKRRVVVDAAPVVDINTTPLIDVMLVLLIMLIITIPVQLHSVNLNMPTGNPPPSEVKPVVLRLDIDATSAVLWDGEVLPDRGEVERRMAEVAALPVQPEVHLRPDRRARYETVAAVLASAQRIGLTKIGIVGSEQFVK
ncbi:biopolymer transporter ExbD [Pseudorhodoferax sp. Leaf274]|uniref:ExbD/TolR family protein n=1 Tax=Pseudorhodoferax sp. Leaf274 TaxID=1736318 RepID=UPI000703A140|nr:biopolymer transporter ExbD [Pseudorhodoferax sp. Leaf274]KQP38929.1 biopolymer transporter ExbD [Pseudorhodoferax sp. Leaf274]